MDKQTVNVTPQDMLQTLKATPQSDTRHDLRMQYINTMKESDEYKAGVAQKAQELQKMVDFARMAKAEGFTPDQVDAALKQRGSSLEDVGNILTYGADRLANVRQYNNLLKNTAPSNTFWDNVTTQDVIDAANFAVERGMNALTLGGLEWLDTKLGGDMRNRLDDYKEGTEKMPYGWVGDAAMLVTDVTGGALSPFGAGIGMLGGKATQSISNPLVRDVANGAITGSAFGGLRAGFDSDFDPEHMAKGAAIGGAIGGGIPLVKEGVKLGAKGVKNAFHAGRNAADKITHNALSKSADDMALGAQDISGRMPDSGEITGTAVKNLTDDVAKTVKTKSSAMYDQVDKLAAGKPVVLDKNSNFAKTFQKLADTSTKSGRAELNKIWDEVGHSTYDAPNYETAKTLRSMLSAASKNAGTALNGKQYGELIKALDKDINNAIGNKAFELKQLADAAYSKELNDPDSITSSVTKILGKSGNKSVSEIGSRATASAQGKAWKASSLKKIIEEGEKIGSPYVADVKQALQANTTTRAQFNRMSPEQKLMVYGDKLGAAEKNFNGGILNWAENAANKTVDTVTNPVIKALELARPVSGTVGGLTVTGINTFEPYKKRK